MPVNINEIKHSEALRQEFGVLGGFRIALDETVAPVAIVADLASSALWRDAFCSDPRSASGVGNINVWSVSNPAGSGALVNLYYLSLSSFTGNGLWNVTVTSTPTALATPLSAQWQNLTGIFVIPNTFPVGDFRHEAILKVLNGQTVWSAMSRTNEVIAWTPDVLLFPGQAITVFQDAENASGQCSVQWRERPLLPSES